MPHSRKSRISTVFLIAVILALLTPVAIEAQQFSSSHFTVSNPMLSPGGLSTSTHFSLNGAISQIVTGENSVTDYKLFSGFFYYPFVTTPVVSATPGDGQVSLTWTSASAGVGWSVSGYKVGKSSAAGGPYSFSSAGNVLSYSAASLTNGTKYYFVIQVLDGLGNTIATSTEVSATPASSGSVPAGGGGVPAGGGGGGGPVVSSGTGSVTFTGRAYPGSSVTLLKDAAVVGTTAADSNANFSISLNNLTPGTYIFSVYSEDNSGNRSSLVTFPVSVTNGYSGTIGGIFIAPTIALDKQQVKKGDNLQIFGQTAKSSDVVIQVNSDQEIFGKTTSDQNGVYLYDLDSSPLDYGDHTTKSKASLNGEISQFSAVAAFSVGTVNIFASKTTAKKALIGDVNGDGRVNLVDFSIVAYWYGRRNPPKNVDINGDGKVSLIDFSILAYHWTG